MRGTLPIALIILLLAGCSGSDQSWISIRNDMALPIYALPYSSDYTSGEWIHPGVSEDFFSIDSDYLDAYEYFSLYYDSLIIFIKDYDAYPVKFYQDGTTVNYDPSLNPFINPEVWKSREFDRRFLGSSFTPPEEKHIYDHYFSVDALSVQFFPDSFYHQLDPAL